MSHSAYSSTDRRNLFATILFVLPSHFTGGSISVSHEDFSAEYETVGNTILETQVVCWYTGVAYKIAPITTGHRLVLAYHIYNTAQNPCPTLPSTSSLSARLTKVLLAWKRDRTGQSPTKLLYLLDGAYPATSLKKTALEGADARTLAVLEILASHHGFGLGMAHVVVALTGTADDKGHRMEEDEFGGWRGSGCAYDDVSDEEAEDLEFLDVESWDVNVWPFVDLEGDKILESLEYKEDLSEMVPKLNPARDMWHEAHDDQEYTKDMYRAGRLERSEYLFLPQRKAILNNPQPTGALPSSYGPIATNSPLCILAEKVSISPVQSFRRWPTRFRPNRIHHGRKGRRTSSHSSSQSAASMPHKLQKRCATQPARLTTSRFGSALSRRARLVLASRRFQRNAS